MTLTAHESFLLQVQTDDLGDGASFPNFVCPVPVRPETTTFIQFAKNDVIPVEFENSGYAVYLAQHCDAS